MQLARLGVVLLTAAACCAVVQDVDAPHKRASWPKHLALKRFRGGDRKSQIFTASVLSCSAEFHERRQQLLDSAARDCPWVKLDPMSLDYYCQVEAGAMYQQIIGVDLPMVEFSDGLGDIMERWRHEEGSDLAPGQTEAQRNAHPPWSVGTWVSGFLQLYQLVMQEPLSRRALYGNDVLPTLHSQHWLLQLAPQTSGLEHTLPSGELEAWHQLFDNTGGKKWKVCSGNRNTPCLCGVVRCGAVDGDAPGTVHILAIALAHGDGSGDMPRSIGKLKYLELLDLEGMDLSKWASSLFELQRLRTLVLSPRSLPQDWGMLASSGSLQSLSISLPHPTQYGSEPDIPAVPERGGFPALCALTSLRSLVLDGVMEPIPKCIGNLTQLVRLRITGGQPGGTLPPQLGKLKALRVFVAFHNAEYECPIQASSQKTDNATTGLTPADCTLKSTFAGELQDHPHKFICSRGALSGTIPDELQEWGETINKVWLDGNRISGTLPDWIGHRWTNLRRLDLHDNLFSGTLPSSLGQLQHLQKLQVQQNFFAGDLPVFRTDELIHLNVGMNRGLYGCLRGDFEKTLLVLAGTNITSDCDSVRDSREEL